jgi:hypothetical protein
MTSEKDTDPDAIVHERTNPTFPPKLGRTGPAPVSVTAVQGPGVDASTTDRLLTGLLVPDDKQNDKKRNHESSGDKAAAYNISPRPVPVAHTTQDIPNVVIAPPSAPVKRSLESTHNLKTVSSSLRRDRFRRMGGFFAALLLVGSVGWLLLRKPAPMPAPVAPLSATAPPIPIPIASPSAGATSLPVAPVPGAETQEATAADPATVTADPEIESRMLKHPPRNAPLRASATTSAAAAPPASVRPVPVNPNGPPPDFDELKKGIKH